MKVVAFQHQRTDDGAIIYGRHPLGLFLISGDAGPEVLGWPGITLKDGMKLSVGEDGQIRPYNES